MGLFSYIFSSGKKSDGLSKIKYTYLSRREVVDLVSGVKINSLSQKEEQIVESVLLERLSHYNKISLKEFDEILYKLIREHKIDDADRRGLLKVFKLYFDKKNNIQN